MSNYSTTQFNTQTVPVATAAAVGSGAQRLMRVILTAGSGAAATVEFKNAATDTGTVLLTLAAATGTSIDVDLCEVGGLFFSTGMFCKPAGAGSLVYVWYT